jgi:hypothetical protein
VNPATCHQSFWIARCPLAALLAVCISLSACRAERGEIEVARQDVEEFHSQFDSEQYAAIYASADHKLHDAMSEAEFVNFLQGVHRKLGAVQNSTLRRTNFAWHNSGHATIRLDYDTSFVQGSGIEIFLWEVADHHVLLYRYKINSKDLAINESTCIPPSRE